MNKGTYDSVSYRVFSEEPSEFLIIARPHLLHGPQIRSRMVGLGGTPKNRHYPELSIGPAF